LALKWLSDNQVAWDAEKYQQNRKLIYELNDAVTNGIIRMYYDFLPTVYDTLSSDLQSHLILYRNDLLSRLQFRSSRDQLVHCISFAAYLMKEGILCARDISPELISRYHTFADTIGDTYICLYSVRYFLQFLADHGIIAGYIPLVLTSPLQARAAGYAIRGFSKKASSFESVGTSSDVYWQKAHVLVGILRKEFHYNEDAARNNYLVYYQMFYIFMSEFSIPYTKENVRIWACGMDGFMDAPHRRPSIKRCFYVLDVFFRTGTITGNDLETAPPEPPPKQQKNCQCIYASAVQM
jgi:hypothetical protein